MKKYLFSIMVSLALIGLVAGLVLAQGQAQAPAAKTEKVERDQISLVGMIDFIGGRYYMKSERPPSEFIIVNQNSSVLEPLYRGKKKVSIEGYTTIGADRLFIQKIDGQPYEGEKPPAAK
jgi:hypothetical protein